MKRDNITLTVADELFLLDSQIANLKKERAKLAEKVKAAILASPGEEHSYVGVLCRYTLTVDQANVIDSKHLKETYPAVYAACLKTVERERLTGYALSIN
jgi:hypothetical protein